MAELVQYGVSRPTTGQRVLESRFAFEATIARLERAIVARELWVVAALDPQLLTRRAGFELLPARQLLFFHPRFVARILAANPSALVEAPLKIVVLELPDGSVRVHAPDPRSAFTHYDGLASLGDELAPLCNEIVEAGTL
jgi:uncharacterized protein (DUF302 family)